MLTDPVEPGFTFTLPEPFDVMLIAPFAPCNSTRLAPVLPPARVRFCVVAAVTLLTFAIAVGSESVTDVSAFVTVTWFAVPVSLFAFHSEVVASRIRSEPASGGVVICTSWISSSS